MSKGSGLVRRSERRRNARKERLRALVPRGGAVIGIDLGEDKQALAVVDHDVRVLWRKTARVKAHELGEALDLVLAGGAGGGVHRGDGGVRADGAAVDAGAAAVRAAGPGPGVRAAAGVAYRPGAAATRRISGMSPMRC